MTPSPPSSHFHTADGGLLDAGLIPLSQAASAPPVDAPETHQHHQPHASANEEEAGPSSPASVADLPGDAEDAWKPVAPGSSPFFVFLSSLSLPGLKRSTW